MKLHVQYVFSTAKKKTRIPACDEQLSNFACPGHVLICSFHYLVGIHDLLHLLPTGQVRMELLPVQVNGTALYSSPDLVYFSIKLHIFFMQKKNEIWLCPNKALQSNPTDLWYIVVPSFTFLFLQFDGNATHSTLLDTLHQMGDEPMEKQ